MTETVGRDGIVDATRGIEDLRAEAEEIQREIDAKEAGDLRLVAGDEQPVWSHDRIDYLGESWEVRKPQPQALAAFALASGKYISPEMQNDMVGLFIRNHMSEESYRHAFERMLDPADEFSQESLGELMQRIATLGTGRPTEPSSA